MKNQPEIIKNHKNPPETIKIPPETMKDQPGTMTNQPQIMKSHKNEFIMLMRRLYVMFCYHPIFFHAG